ncbi:hypothetical protein DL764_007610 [Monosporascus ibericus]|uniref:Uncharacterized protein n=1 Tax=Monosporascus ibericus TaxID=155417 RepID=A0A4Q4T345_9PEZI|nr:hypothetical protein DL764_007610 [Monosporascus ibericus]
MARRLLFTVFALVPGVRAGDDLSDFSNNLATDLGPLLALFGDSITVQYLSESTSFLDYFIFAMAPIGIITAVVSTIRVCGSPSLRAFIGRSQEGDATIEAALCTSTSRDVCEMFNKGGITRVLGRPNILELVHNPSCSPNENLNLFRSYLESGSVSCEWGRTTRPAGTQSGRCANTETLAPTPNLSLNVGIIQRPRWVYFAVAGIGFILQSFTLALAGVGVWVLDWTLSEDSGTAARNYAPSMFIIGTILLSAGMWSCAALIGQTTHEIRFERQGLQESWLSQLIWLQPGPQVIGDQSFDSFAVFEQEGKPLKVWTSSTKDLTKKYEAHTWIAISMVLLGYIMQFIGIRGMQAWISLTQLGITVVMSFLRGMLRAKRLNKNDNALRDMPDLVARRELDWLTFELVKRSTGKRGSEYEPYWQFNGRYRKAREQFDNTISHKAPGLGIQTISGETPGLALQSPSSDGDVEQAARFRSTNMASQKDVLNYEDMLSVRTRLARLTGHTSMSSLSSGQYQAWKDDFVAARKNAHRLSSAVCMAAKSLHPSRRPKRYELCIQVSSGLDRNGISPEHGLIEVFIPLWSPQNSQRSTWQIDSAMLESVLGLWMWSLLYNAQSLAFDDFGNQVSRAEEVKRVRIVAAGALQKPDTQPELNLWLGPDDDVKVNDGIVTLPHNVDDDGLSGLWSCDLQEERWTLQTQAAARFYPGTRFCGWSLVYEALAARTPGSANASSVASHPTHARGDVQIQYVRTEQSLLDLCTQELFTVLLMSLIRHTGVGETTVMESSGHIRLKNPVVDSFAKAFTESNLGSHSEALLCIIPALGEHARPSPDRLLGVVFKEAEAYRKQSEWERAETLLRWACAYCDEPHRQNRDAVFTHRHDNVTMEPLRRIGELYRWSLASCFIGDTMPDERRRFGLEGIEWMQKRYKQAQAAGIREILDDYQYIRVAIGTPPPRKEVAMKELVRAIRDRQRKDALHWLCFLDVRDFYSRDLNPALPLAVRNGWDEVVLACLELKADINGQDEEGRTALSYSAELGSERWAGQFIGLGARLDLADTSQNTPLAWAVKGGNLKLVKALLDTSQVNPDIRNSAGETPLWQAADRGEEGIVQLLLERVADTEVRDNYHFQTPLWRSIENGYESILVLLLEKGADMEARNFENRPASDWRPAGGRKYADAEDCWRTPLFRAAELGNETAVRLLIEKGVDTEAKVNGDTALKRAAEMGHPAIVRLFLLNGFHIETTTRGSTLMKLAVEHGHVELVRMLVQEGAKVEARGPKGMSMLCEAAWRGHEAIVQVLLQAGAHIDYVSENGTPLYLAVLYKRGATARLLIEKGADVDRAPDFASSPLHAAAYTGQESVAQLLIENGANVHYKNKSGSTALWKATYYGHEAIVKLLLQHGAGSELDGMSGLPRFLTIEKEIEARHEQKLLWVAEQEDDEAVEEKKEELAVAMGKLRAILRLLRDYQAEKHATCCVAAVTICDSQ